MQIEIQLKQKQEQNSGFRRVACTRTGTTLTSACAICLVVAHLAIALCSARTLTRTLIATGCARSCRFLNNMCAGLHVRDSLRCKKCKCYKSITEILKNVTKMLQAQNAKESYYDKRICKKLT